MNASGSRPIPEFQTHPLPESGNNPIADFDRLIMEAGRAHEGLARVRAHHRTFLAVTDIGFIREILLTRRASYRRAHNFGRPLLGESLLTSGVPGWQRRRRHIGNLFRFEMLDILTPIVREEVALTLDRWAEIMASGGPLMVAEEMRRLMIRTLTAAILGSADADERERLGWTIVDGLRQTHQRNEDGFQLPRVIPTPGNRRLTRTMHSVDGIIRGAIEHRRAALAGPQQRDILDAMLAIRDPQSGAPMKDDAILAEIKALLAAGIDTTASALTHALELLSADRDAAFSWYAEVDYQLHGRPLERRDLARLPRLTQIVNEVLRLYPPVPTLSRECIVPDVLGGHEIRAGTRLQLSVLAVHRDERFWRDPDEFRPGRFAREWPRHAHLPFGLGQHACVGSNFALVQLLMILAMIGQRFRIEALPDDGGSEDNAGSGAEGARNGDDFRLRLIPRS